MTCPYCGSTDVDAEFVDVGVGHDMQVTPWECASCWARQMNPHAADYNSRGTEEERRLGWFRGPKCWACLDTGHRWVQDGNEPASGHNEVCHHPLEAQNNIRVAE